MSSNEEQLRRLVEGHLLQREDALSQLVGVAEEQQRWQAHINCEAQQQILSLREELSAARRREAQREREVQFLQKQLQDAALRLSDAAVDT